MKIKKRKERKVREGFNHHSAKLNVKYGTEAIILDNLWWNYHFLEINYYDTLRGKKQKFWKFGIMWN